MPLILTNPDVEKLLTMKLCMDALDYAYGELGRDNAAMGPVIRVAAPLESGTESSDGSKFFYHYSAMAGVLP